MGSDGESEIAIYPDGAAEALDNLAVASFLEDCGAAVRVEGEIFDPDAAGAVAPALAAAKIADPARGTVVSRPFAGEISYEADRIRHRRRSSGIVYEGHRLQEVFREALPAERRLLGSRVVVITGRLFGTLDPGDGRFHLRSALFGWPVMLSTAGAVEAPARPREFYRLKAGLLSAGADPTMARVAFSESCLGHDDARITAVMKGYAAQALFFFVDGSPFCPDARCRLYNAHWQSELLASQAADAAGFCPAHEKRIEGFRTVAANRS